MDWKARWQRFNKDHGSTLVPLIVFLLTGLVIYKVKDAKDLADLLRAIASLAWPGVALLGMFWFRSEIRSLLARIRKGKFLGNEFELDVLETKTSQAEEKVEEKARAAADGETRGDGEIQGKVTVTQGNQTLSAAAAVGQSAVVDVIEEVLREAAKSPSLGLMLLSAKLEKSVRLLAEKAGISARRPRTYRAIVDILIQRELLPAEVGDSLAILSRVRNRVVHGDEATEQEIVRAIESGVRLLRTVLAAQGSVTVVRNSDIPLFSDASATIPLGGFSGVIIDIADGAERAIYPTQRRYRSGMRVSMEWNLDVAVKETWYRDPETGQIEKAWQEAAEFVGRPVGDEPITTFQAQ